MSQPMHTPVPQTLVVGPDVRNRADTAPPGVWFVVHHRGGVRFNVTIAS